MDILGVDGVLYKGRMSSQIGTRIGEKDIAGKHWGSLGLPMGPVSAGQNKGVQVDSGLLLPLVVH